MNKTILVYNHSIKHFEPQCRAIAQELANKGCDAKIYTNAELLMRDIPEADKCIFYDKDISLGMRIELNAVRTFNSIGAIELCGDKCRTNELLKDLPQPETVVYPKTFFPDESFFALFTDYVTEKLSFPLVAKLADGSQGREVFLLESPEEVTEFQRKHYAQSHLYQKFISASRGKDIRVFIIGDEVRASMLRYNPNDFRSNVAIGGSATKCDISADVKEICLDAVRLMGLDFAGIDILLGKDGEPYICEVNSNALFTTLAQVCDVNIAEGIASHVLKTKTGFFDDIGALL